MNDHFSFMHDSLEIRPNPAKGNLGVFAKTDIPENTLLMFWGGRIYNWEDFCELDEDLKIHSAQVEENLFIVPLSLDDPTNFINHSCDPSAGFSDATSIISMRKIKKDEEVCFDYAMCDSLPYDQFECACGSTNCRGQITGNDWKIPGLQEKYAGYFSPYLGRRIKQLSLISKP